MTWQRDRDRETERLRRRIDEGDRARDRQSQEDVVVEDPRRLFLRSANGTFFALRVDDAGNLSTVNMGTSL